MGVRLDLPNGSDLGIDIPGGAWASAFQIWKLRGVSRAFIRLMDEFIPPVPSKLIGDLAILASVEVESRFSPEGEAKELASRMHKLCLHAVERGEGLVWS